jgi:cell fate (sporulation/competence/biofilm development) regulator YlbF (YheA/YmcA/DUF963 family)
MEMFLTLVLQVLLAVVVAKLTLAGSKSQKWWERKADLYANLIERLYDIHSYLWNWIDNYQEADSTLSAERKAQREAEATALLERNRKAREEVEKLAHTGTFLISDEVHQDLLAFKKTERDAREKYDHWSTFELVCDIFDAAAKCIERVREHSKDDLGLNSRLGRLIRKVRSLFSE